MAEAQILVTRLVKATDRADARRRITDEPWVFAFPAGSTIPGKVIPLKVQYDKLTLLTVEVVGTMPFVQETGDRFAPGGRIAYVVTVLLTFQHPQKSSLDTLLRLGTWLSMPTFGEVIEYSDPAPVGTFDAYLKEE